MIGLGLIAEPVMSVDSFIVNNHKNTKKTSDQYTFKFTTVYKSWKYYFEMNTD